MVGLFLVIQIYYGINMIIVWTSARFEILNMLLYHIYRNALKLVMDFEPFKTFYFKQALKK